MYDYSPDAHQPTSTTGAATILPTGPLWPIPADCTALCPSSDQTLTCPPLPWNDDYMSPPVEMLEAFYTFRKPRAIRDFIRGDSEIISALALASDAIRRYYPDARLFLDVYRDHNDTGFELLALRIGTGLRHPETRRRLKMFRADWWGPKVSDSVDARVVVDVEPGYADATL